MAQSGQPPLVGIKVLDLSRIIAGPLCCQQMADMGADILKVENPKTGDDSRNATKPWAGEDSHFFQAFNRNKRSIGLDFREGEGKKIFFKLLEEADVLVENFRPGVTKRLGLDYETLHTKFPSLVYCSVSAYGQEGIMSDRPGLDPVFQAEMGLMSLCGEIDGGPIRHPLSIIDLFTSLYASTAVCAAIADQNATGQGRHIDMSLMGGAISVLGNVAQYYFTCGEAPPRMGNGFPTVVPVGAFAGSDGYLFYLACGTQRLYENLVVKALNRTDLLEDARFALMGDRVKNRELIMPMFEEIFATQPRDYWVDKLRSAGVPCGPVRNLPEALESPEVLEAGLVQTIEHPTAGKLRTLKSPIGLSDRPNREDTPPPLLGEHTDEILQSILQLSDVEIDELRVNEVIA